VNGETKISLLWEDKESRYLHGGNVTNHSLVNMDDAARSRFGFLLEILELLCIS